MKKKSKFLKDLTPLHLLVSKKAATKPVVDLWPPPNLPKALYGDQGEAFKHCQHHNTSVTKVIFLQAAEFSGE